MWDMPYFMTNRKWYKYDFEKRMFVLTKYATEEAKKSYKEYLKTRQDGD
jgi:hypothetical protein